MHRAKKYAELSIVPCVVWTQIVRTSCVLPNLKIPVVKLYVRITTKFHD